MTSPLSALNNRAQLAASATPQIRLHEVLPFSLIQISAWPDRLTGLDTWPRQPPGAARWRALDDR